MIAIVLSSVVSAVVCVGIYVLVTRFITKNTSAHSVKPPSKRRRPKAK